MTWARRRQRMLAEALFHLYALRVLLRPFGALAIVWLVGAALHVAYGASPGQPDPSWSEAFFISYNLLFMEHLTELPAHPVGQAVQYIQPLFGIFLLAEGIVKLGITVFRKEENQEKWMSIVASTSRGHVILCGLGNVGYRVLEELTSLGHPVFAVEVDADCPNLDRARELGAEVMVADARTEGTLNSLNLKAARALLVATDDDLANMEIAMDAREADAKLPIVLRLFDQRLAEKVKASLDVQVSFSTSKLAAPLLAAAALDRDVVGAHRVGDQVLVVLEIQIEGLAGKKISELTPLYGITPVALWADGWQTAPSGAHTLKAGDRLQLMVCSDQTDAIHRLNA